MAHSHSHGDHTAGDVQFADRPDTTVLGADLAAVTGFFGLPDWPQGTAQLDLGGRVVDVIPSPGHDQPAVTYYDRSTGLLLTGDTVYPGRTMWRSQTGRRLPPRRTGCWPSPRILRFATCSVGTSR